MLPTITEAYPPVPLDELVTALRLFDSMTRQEKFEFLDRLIKSHPIVSFDWGPGWRFRRARILAPEEVPGTVDEVIWRKGVPAKLGRANPVGFQVLYLTDRPDTAIQEVSHHAPTNAPNHPVMLAEFAIQHGRTVRIAPIGELVLVQRRGRGYFAGEVSHQIQALLNACSLDDAKSLLIADSFLLQCLTNTEGDYELSSRIAVSIFRKLPKVMSIAYPSVRQLGAINLAVRTEKFWEDWGLVSVRRGLAEHLAQGFYRFSEIRHVDAITVDGALQWRGDSDIENSVILLGPHWTPSE